MEFDPAAAAPRETESEGRGRAKEARFEGSLTDILARIINIIARPRCLQPHIVVAFALGSPIASRYRDVCDSVCVAAGAGDVGRLLAMKWSEGVLDEIELDRSARIPATIFQKTSPIPRVLRKSTRGKRKGQ